jgi:hypothetical protein
MQRSNVRMHSNVHLRLPTVEVRDDASFRKAVRTREAILALHPFVKAAYGIDWSVARIALSDAQLEVVQNHFPCPTCGRWDRWPVAKDGSWALSHTPLGCRCERVRAAESQASPPSDTRSESKTAAVETSMGTPARTLAVRKQGRGGLRGGL